jgi:hypothetical protein
MTHSPDVANTQPASKRHGFQAGEYTLREQLRVGHAFKLLVIGTQAIDLLEIDEAKNNIPSNARVEEAARVWK